MEEYPVRHGEPNPDAVIADMARRSGHSEEELWRRWGSLFEPVTEDKIEFLMMVFDIPREKAEIAAATTLVRLLSPEEEAKEAEKLRQRAAKHNKKTEDIYIPVRSSLGSFVSEHSIDADPLSRLRELDRIAEALVYNVATSDEIVDWFSTVHEDLWGMPPIVIIAGGDQHQINSVNEAAHNHNKPEGAWKVVMPDSFQESLRNLDQPTPQPEQDNDFGDVGY